MADSSSKDLMSKSVIDAGATLSKCGTYRYSLWRKWDDGKPTLTFVMLNPSTADDVHNDPTVERCQRRAIMLGYGRLCIVNLMAYRATNPADLVPLPRHVSFGPDNQRHLFRSAFGNDGTVICGWGKHGHVGPVAWFKRHAVNAGKPLYALRINKDGSPAHPLYIPYSQQPVWWAGAKEEER